jgi:parallel beta-helix repeat protein
MRSAKENDIKYNSFITNEYGIHLSNADSNNISCNYIYNNSYGIYLKAGSTGNNISYNNIIANTPWQFYNDQDDDVTATNNWWGTTDNDAINASVYDWTYASSKGNVTYRPKLDGESPCAEIPEPLTLVMVTLGLFEVIGAVYRKREQ